jgi:hypothetical protein
LGEHLLCKQGVIGSIPISSTRIIYCFLIAVILTVAAIKKQAGNIRQVSTALGQTSSVRREGLDV